MIVDDEQGRLADKDAYIAEHLMDLQPDTLRFLVADLVFHNRKLTALCDGYRGEVADGYPNLEALSRGMVDGLAEWPMLKVEAAHVLSALTRARAEGMEEAAKVVESVRFWNLASRKEVTDAIRIEACRLAEQAEKGEKE